MMIVVTGADGFIGSALTSRLLENGEAVFACDDRPEEELKLIRGWPLHGYCPWQQLLDQIEGSAVKAFIHMGACSSTLMLDEEYLRQINTECTKTFFRYCAKREIPFIYASSGAVYGRGESGYSEKTDPSRLTPMNPYGWSKVRADEWSIQQTEAPPVWYGLRFFNVYGPGECFKGEMASLVYKAFHQIGQTGQLRLFKSENPQYKDGEQMRDFVYVKDVISWTLKLLEKRPRSGIYNMGSGRARTWLDLAEAVFRSLEKERKVVWIDMPRELADKYQYFTEANMDKLFAADFPRPKWDLEAGVWNYVREYLCKDRKTLREHA